MKPIIYIAFAFALFFNTCKRDGLFFKCKPENTIKIPPHAMDFFYFKTGSWWVYECEQTGYRDSLYAINNFFVVENYKGAKKECNCAWGKCFQNGGVQFYSRQRDSLNLGNNGEKIGYLFNHYHICQWKPSPDMNFFLNNPSVIREYLFEFTYAPLVNNFEAAKKTCNRCNYFTSYVFSHAECGRYENTVVF